MRPVFVRPLRRSSAIGVLVLFLAGLTGCSLFGPDGTRMTATAIDGTVTTGEPAAIDVTVENPEPSPVTWGHGSGTCRLFLLVRVDDTDRPAPLDDGVCTMDDRMYRLDPGETYTRTLDWDGRVRRNDSTVHLDAGTYEVRARASGSDLASNLVSITVEVDSFP